MSGRVFRRFLALGLLGLWLAPGVGALAVGLHVALDHGGGHHDHGDPGHASVAFEELVAAVAHGHHHRVDVPAHEHPAYLESAPGLSSGSCAALAATAGIAGAADHGHGEPAADSHRRPPPGPLFRAHCSLLL